MFEQALKRVDQSLKEFHERTEKMCLEIRQETSQEIHRIEKQTIEMKSEIHQTISQIVNRNTLAIISILGTLMAAFAFVVHLTR